MKAIILVLSLASILPLVYPTDFRLDSVLLPHQTYLAPPSRTILRNSVQQIQDAIITYIDRMTKGVRSTRFRDWYKAPYPYKDGIQWLEHMWDHGHGVKKESPLTPTVVIAQGVAGSLMTATKRIIQVEGDQLHLDETTQQKISEIAAFLLFETDLNRIYADIDYLTEVLYKIADSQVSKEAASINPVKKIRDAIKTYEKKLKNYKKALEKYERMGKKGKGPKYLEPRGWKNEQYTDGIRWLEWVFYYYNYEIEEIFPDEREFIKLVIAQGAVAPFRAEIVRLILSGEIEKLVADRETLIELKSYVVHLMYQQKVNELRTLTEEFINLLARLNDQPLKTVPRTLDSAV